MSTSSSNKISKPSISVSSSNDAAKNKSPRKRNFLGCLTCRKRKVKCDGRRPKCLRCEKSNKECEGYDFKLKFNDILTIHNGQMCNLKVDLGKNEYKRQQLPLMKMPKTSYYSTFLELDSKIKEIEALTEDKQLLADIFIGPFTVFSNQAMLKRYSEHQNAPKASVCLKKENNYKENVHDDNGSLIDHNTSDKPQNLPSISSIININSSSNYIKPSASSFFSNSKILPLPPAIEMNRQRNKQQLQRDILTHPPSSINNENFNKYDSNFSDMNEVDSNPIWIHPRLEIDAILTYQALVGSADVVTQSWELIKKVIFADKYNMTSQLKNRIIDKMYDGRVNNDEHMKDYINHVFRSLAESEHSLVSSPSFTTLLRSQRVQELIRLFVKSQPSVMILNCNGCIFDTVVIPSLYKIVGELMVFDSSVGLPGDWSGKVSENGIEFRHYCDLMKRTYCMVVLAITAFSQYKKLFNEYGIYDGSLKLFKCYISFREMSLINLSIIIKPLLADDEKQNLKVSNIYLLNRLYKAGLLKELVLTLILAIYQDSNLDIINNYQLLYSVLEGIKGQYLLMKTKDKQMDEIWLWFKYIQVFYKSCSKIDLDNYEINEEGFEDVKSGYNLIEDFQFNDVFQKNEFMKIEIAPNSKDNTSKKTGVNPENYKVENDDLDDESNDESDDVDSESEISAQLEFQEIKIPKRLAERPSIPDKPPKSFTVHFHFDENNMKNDTVKDDNDDDDDDDDDYDDDDSEDDNNSIDRIYRTEGENSVNSANTLGNDANNRTRVNALTGLSSGSSNMSFNEREQFFARSGKIQIPNPCNFTSNTKTLELSGISAIEISFGLPLSLLELIEKTVRLADHKNWCLRKKIFPRNFPKICCDLEEDLMSWKNEWDLYSVDRVRAQDLHFHSLFHKALYHLTVAFYNTVLLFFFRLIKETDPNLLQNHVVSTITHLEQLKILSLRSDFLKDMKIFPPFWCFFIAGSNATTSDLQFRFDELARKWFVAGNKWIGKQIMMEVWRVGNEASKNHGSMETVSWLDLIKEWEVSGFN